ncbi:hypothetical protein QTP70_004065 [Hemibagrus guttatus]|uniref:Murine leukemia virus integrase C-terminal domain-containing protein n=1 Tax=Hemibagrus guttatus TaxID=175788 RepID=A0AAE0V8I4_9TELE|nr:hypothetical protein QTP70_004065 [Hemibagrus guttatus]
MRLLISGSQVKNALPKPHADILHDLKPGKWILVKDFKRKNWKAKHWLGPFQILLTMPTTVKIAERATWIHVSHCKRVPVPDQELRRHEKVVEVLKVEEHCWADEPSQTVECYWSGE